MKQLSKHSSPRSVDHLVLPVKDINAARERYTDLGFNVAPDGHHPFGTENCCIFFADNTFLEPLGIAHRETCEARAVKGNTFTKNDQSFRFRRGVEGFSHLAVKSENAKSDDLLYRKHGMFGGKMVRFSRRIAAFDGGSGKVSFKLAFASDPRSPDAHFFACEATNTPIGSRTSLQSHANGVTGINEILLSEVNPTDFQYMLQTFLNQREMDVNSFGMSFDTPTAKITVLSPDGMRAFHGLETQRAERGLLFQGFVVNVKDIRITRELLVKNNQKFVELSGRLVVGPAPGQGTAIIFEGNG